MLFKKQINFSTTTILLIGLAAFIFCQAHPGIGDEHAPIGAEESCQIMTIPSAIMAAPIVAGQNLASGHAEYQVCSSAALDLGSDYLNQTSGKAVSPSCSFSNTKRYQLICTYRL